MAGTPNGYISLGQTFAIAPSIRMPIVSRELYRVRPYDDAYLAYWNANRAIKGGVKKMGDRKFTSLVTYPRSRQMRLLTAATAGSAVSATVTNRCARNTVENDVWVYPETGENVRIDSTPTSAATTVTFETVVTTIPAGATLIRMANVIGESWAIPDAVQRNTGSFENYITQIASAHAISKHLSWLETYLGSGKYELHLKEDWLDFIDLDKNMLLALSEPRDGTNDGVFKGAGIFYLGQKYNNINVNGSFSETDYHRLIAHIQTTLGRNINLRAFVGRNLWSGLSRIRRNGAIVNFLDENSVKRQFGEKEIPKLVNPYGVADCQVSYDRTLDEKGFEDCMVIVNFSALEAITHGQEELIIPTATHPNGVATFGSGDMKSMWQGHIGFKPLFPPGVCWFLKGINKFVVD